MGASSISLWYAIAKYDITKCDVTNPSRSPYRLSEINIKSHVK